MSQLLDMDTRHFQMSGWPEQDCGYSKCWLIWLGSAAVAPGKAAAQRCQPSFASWETGHSARGTDPEGDAARARAWQVPCVLLCRAAPGSDQDQPENHWTTTCWTVKTWLVVLLAFKRKIQIASFSDLFSSNIGASPLQIDSPTSREGHSVLLHRPWELTTFQMATTTYSRGAKQSQDPSAKGSSCLKTLHKMLPKQRGHPDHQKDMDFFFLWW